MVMYSPGAVFPCIRDTGLWAGEMSDKGKDRTRYLPAGGDFIVDYRGTISFAHQSIDPVDRPKAAELLSLLKGDGWRVM